MKKFTAILVYSTFSISLLFAQPKANFLKTDHEFGQINEEDGVVEADFYVVNTGNQPLVLKEVKASCGCTDPEWTHGAIAPGDSGLVRAKFNPYNLPGPFTKMVHVTTNGQPNTVSLFFTGMVIPRQVTIVDRFPLEQGKLRLQNNYIPFNQAMMGDIDSIEFLVYNQSEEDIWITNITNVPAFINFEIPNLRLRPNQESIITAKFDTKASNKWGEHHFVFYLNTSDSIYTNEIPLYSQIHIREKFPARSKKELDNAPKIQVDAHMLTLGKLLRGDSMNFQYTITNLGKEKLLIRGVNTTCGCTATTIGKTELKRGESTVVKVTFNSEGREGEQEKYIYIVSNDPVTPELRIGFTAEVVTNPNALKY